MSRLTGFALVFVSLSMARAQSTSSGDSPMRGDLAAGAHGVGFRLIEQADDSRRVQLVAGQAKFSGRPIRLYVWYPAVADGGVRMAFSRYAELMDADFWPKPVGNDGVGDFNNGPLARSLSPERLASVLRTSTQAVDGASAADGRFPLIVLGQGLYYESPIAHAMLCEFLASRGYVVATCPLIGTRSRLVNLDAVDLETQVRDLEFVMAAARRLPFVHEKKLGLLGFDMGGMSCVVLAMRDPDVDAFVSLDAGILYPHPSQLPGSSPHYSPERLSVPWLHITRREAVPSPDAPGSLFDTAVHAERFLALVDGVQHADFTSFALIEGKEPVIGYWRRSSEHSRRRYEAVCRMMARFFDAFLRGDESARAGLIEPAGGADGDAAMTVRHRSAKPVPATVDDLVNTIAARGVETAIGIVRKVAEACPDCNLAQDLTLNSLGYKYLYFWGHTDTAIAIFRLNVELHPDSANAYDSLGEAYAMKGDREAAILNYRKALKLDPSSENAKAALRRLEGQ